MHLKRKFGRIDFESEILPFSHTDYYAEEFGRDLKRKFISFEKLIPPQSLAQIKIFTNRLEQRLTLNNRRQINIDPGYLNFPKLILASTKDFKHRVYLDKGVFAEITLFYQDKAFRAWEWTYPDYKSPAYLDIFNKIRETYVSQIQDK